MQIGAPKIADGPPAVAAGTLIDLSRSARRTAIEALAGREALLVLAPHPDDETLGCGQAIAAAVATGLRVVIVQVTDGAASHPGSREYPPDALAALRSREFSQAVQVLSGDRIETLSLGLPDGALFGDAGHEAQAVAALTPVCIDRGIDTIWTSWDGDPHADHQAVAGYARRLRDALAARHGKVPRILFYAVWGRFGAWGNGACRESIRLFDDPDCHPIKRAAMACYGSQLTPLIDDAPAGFVMPGTLTEHFATHPEIFLDDGS